MKCPSFEFTLMWSSYREFKTIFGLIIWFCCVFSVLAAHNLRPLASLRAQRSHKLVKAHYETVSPRDILGIMARVKVKPSGYAQRSHSFGSLLKPVFGVEA